MSRSTAWKTICILFVFSAAAPMVATAQTVTTLASFDITNGAEPLLETLVQGLDGNFYGTTYQGGTGAHTNLCPAGTPTCGVVFKVTPGGVLTTIYDFCAEDMCADGAGPTAGLILGLDGNFYGTSAYGGTQNISACGGEGCGTVFKITPEGVLTTLRKFRGIDGSAPVGPLLQGSDGNFYGTTSGGGTGAFCSGLSFGCGTVFRISSDGAFIRLYNFCSQPGCADGAVPIGGLMEDIDGNFYGTTQVGGQSVCTALGNQGCGTIFKISTNGTLSTLYRFANSDGAGPQGALVQGNDGFLYGTTRWGGSTSCSGAGCGTVFKMTIGGKLKTLVKFSGSNGQAPDQPLALATDGSFYGTTIFGGDKDNGTVFKISPAGALTTVYSSFSSSSTLAVEPVGLIQGTDGSFYGITSYGGASSNGSVFNVSVGLSPFVEALPESGVIGKQVTILGNDLTGATSVSFNGTAASFTVVSAMQITATVPTGATTGSIVVTTPTATLSSNATFKVTPQVLSFSPTSGAAGSSVVITGKSLTEAKAVSFHGTLATSFTVNSDTQITATVPNGATTGWIAVRTVGGRSQSASSFSVTP